MAGKTCKPCRETKPLAAFQRDSGNPSGFGSRCKACHAEQQREYRANNRDKYREQRRERYAKNRDKELERCREYYARNRDKVRERKREYCEKNRDRLREKTRERYRTNPLCRMMKANSEAKRRARISAEVARERLDSQPTDHQE